MKKGPMTLTRSVISSLTLLALPALGACTIGPENGQTFQGSTVGESVSFLGYTTDPSASVRVQILDPAAQDPHDPASTWATIGSGVSSATPYYHNSTDPLYGFNLSATPRNAGQAARWRNGGLARLRVQWDQGGTWATTATFDDFDCLLENAAEDWETIGSRCISHDTGVITLVDTDPQPAAVSQYISRRANAASESAEYYDTVGAGPGESRETFAGWLEANGFTGFPVRLGTSATATYYNRGDLGIGREMHCRKNLTRLTPLSIPIVQSIACYVHNYGSFLDGTADEASALADAIAHTNAFATVAMEWYPGGGANDVRFFVYGQPGGNLLNDAQLDSEGAKPMPGLCLACHGGTYDPASNTITGAQFLPFDLDSFGYSSAAGSTQADQEEGFRIMNRFVNDTSPTDAIAELIDGWYGGNVATANTTFDGSFVPDDWSGEEYVYTEVVGKYCRMCHQSQTGSFDFADLADFTALAASIQASVCGSYDMPHAEIPRQAFWESSARAHLFGGVLGLYPDCN
jgi:hypothetical protein